MLLKNKLRLLLLLLIALFFHIKKLQAQGTFKIEADDAYAYPVTPEMKEWKEMKTYTAKVVSCKVPTELLEKMSTKGLLKTALEYPLWFDLFWFNTLRDGYSVMKGRNKALAEFVQREDAPQVITDLYLSFEVNPFDENWTNVRKGRHSYQLILLESILLDYAFFSKLSGENKKELARSCLEKLPVMQTMPKVYGTKTLAETAGFGGRLLNDLQYKPFRKLLQSMSYESDFLERNFPPNGMTFIARTIALLTEFSKNKIPKKRELKRIFKNNTEEQQCIKARTQIPNGIAIFVRKYLEEPLSPAEIEMNSERVRTIFPHATILGDASGKYNGHAYALQSDAEEDTIWIEKAYSKYYRYTLTTDPKMYSRIAYEGYISSGQRVNHWARKKDFSSSTYISKWGNGPLVEHPPTYCPYYEDPDCYLVKYE